MSPAQEQLRRSYKRSYKTYSYEQLVAAYLYVKEKRVAVKFAARAFGVPPSTLNDRVQGKVFIDTSIVMNNPGGRKILPKPNLNRFSRINEKVSMYFDTFCPQKYLILFSFDNNCCLLRFKIRLLYKNILL